MLLTLKTQNYVPDTRCNIARKICVQRESCTVCPPLKLLRATLRATVSPCVHHLQHCVQLRDATFFFFWLRKNSRVQGCVTCCIRSVAQCCSVWLSPVPKVARNDASRVRSFSSSFRTMLLDYGDLNQRFNGCFLIAFLKIVLGFRNKFTTIIL